MPTSSLCAEMVKEGLYLSCCVCVCVRTRVCLLEVRAQPHCQLDLGIAASHLLGYWIQ